MSDGVVDYRSLTMGVGSFTWSFHHLQELVGRDADKVVEARKQTKALACAQQGSGSGGPEMESRKEPV